MGADHGSQRPRKTKITAEARTFAQYIVRSLSYRRSLMTRAAAGTLPAGVEVMLWHYAYGKPVKTVAVDIRDERAQVYSQLSEEELAARAAELSREILTRKTDLENAEKQDALRGESLPGVH